MVWTCCSYSANFFRDYHLYFDFCLSTKKGYTNLGEQKLQRGASKGSHMYEAPSVRAGIPMSLNFKYSHLEFWGVGYVTVGINFISYPSWCCLSQLIIFHRVLCCCFQAISFVRILPWHGFMLVICYLIVF